MGQEGGKKGQQSPSLSSSLLRDFQRTCHLRLREEGVEVKGGSGTCWYRW